MRLVRYWLAIALGALVISPALGQVRKGMVEVAFTGNLGWNQYEVGSLRSDTLSIGVDGHAGYFVSEHVDVGGSLGFNYTHFSASDRNTHRWSLAPGFNYHFTPPSRVVPFVGADVGYFRSGGDVRPSDGWLARVRVGADLFLNPHVALKFGLAYQREEVDGGFNDPLVPALVPIQLDVSYDALNAFVGLAIFLN